MKDDPDFGRQKADVKLIKFNSKTNNQTKNNLI